MRKKGEKVFSTATSHRQLFLPQKFIYFKEEEEEEEDEKLFSHKE